jgi:hypothetical protein
MLNMIFHSLPQCCGSGVFFWKNITDHISESFVPIFWGLKILKFLVADPVRCLVDLGSGIRDFTIRIRDKHPGSKHPDPQHYLRFRV